MNNLNVIVKKGRFICVYKFYTNLSGHRDKQWDIEKY